VGATGDVLDANNPPHKFEIFWTSIHKKIALVVLRGWSKDGTLAERLSSSVESGSAQPVFRLVRMQVPQTFSLKIVSVPVILEKSVAAFERGFSWQKPFVIIPPPARKCNVAHNQA